MAFLALKKCKPWILLAIFLKNTLYYECESAVGVEGVEEVRCGVATHHTFSPVASLFRSLEPTRTVVGSPGAKMEMEREVGVGVSTQEPEPED